MLFKSFPLLYRFLLINLAWCRRCYIMFPMWRFLVRCSIFNCYVTEGVYLKPLVWLYKITGMCEFDYCMCRLHFTEMIAFVSLYVALDYTSWFIRGFFSVFHFHARKCVLILLLYQVFRWWLIGGIYKSIAMKRVMASYWIPFWHVPRFLSYS